MPCLLFQRQSTDYPPDGAHRYFGSHEYLCWDRIPGNAVLATFALDDLKNTANEVPAISRILREPDTYPQVPLSVLIDSRHGEAREQRGLSEIYLGRAIQSRQCLHKHPNGNSNRTNDRVAGNDSRFDNIALVHIVSDLVKGFRLTVKYCTPEWFEQLAERFAQAFVLASKERISIYDQDKLKLALLTDISYGEIVVNAL